MLGCPRCCPHSDSLITVGEKSGREVEPEETRKQFATREHLFQVIRRLRITSAIHSSLPLLPRFADLFQPSPPGIIALLRDESELKWNQENSPWKLWTTPETSSDYWTRIGITRSGLSVWSLVSPPNNCRVAGLNGDQDTSGKKCSAIQHCRSDLPPE